MPLVEITFNVVAGGAPRKIGERLELDGPEARLLVGANRAKLVTASQPVVIDDGPGDPQPVKKARKPRGKKQADPKPTPCETGNCPIPTTVNNDGPPTDPAV